MLPGIAVARTGVPAAIDSEDDVGATFGHRGHDTQMALREQFACGAARQLAEPALRASRH
jgi:hypothetical protein